MSNYTAWVVQYLHLPAPTGGPVVRENWETLWWTAAGDSRDAIDTYDRLRPAGKWSYQFAKDTGFVRLAEIELATPGRGTVATMGVPQVDGQICCLNCGTHSPLSLFPHRDGLGQVGGVLILCDRCRGRFAGQHLAISVTEPMPDCPPEKAGPPVEKDPLSVEEDLLEDAGWRQADQLGEALDLGITELGGLREMEEPL